MRTISSENVERAIDLAIQNLLQIELNLIQLGYKFANESGPVQFATGRTNAALEELKAITPSLPLFVEKWYDRIAYVDFSQHKVQLYDSLNDPVAGLGLNCTLVFSDLANREFLQRSIERDGFSCHATNGSEFVPLGTYATNCTPKGFWIPDQSTDPVIYDDGGGPVTMFHEIRSSIEVGGFPFWAKMFSKRRVTSPANSVPRFREIEPILIRGIVRMD